MFNIRIVSIIVSLMGLNFSLDVISVIWILSFQFFVLIFTLMVAINGLAYNNPLMKVNFYMFLDVVQLILPYFVRVLVVMHTFRKRNLQRKINQNLMKILQNIGVKKISKKAITNTIAWCVMWIIKLNLVTNFGGRLYNLSMMLTGIFYAANDFYFTYHIDCLTAHLKSIRRRSRTRTLAKTADAILSNIALRLDVERKFSFELCATVSENFMLLISAIYWIFIRIVYRHLNKFSEFATFFYIIHPSFCLYSTFNAYRKLTEEFKKLTKCIFDSTRHSKEKEQLIAQMYHNVPNFLAGGMTPIRYSTICEVNINI